MSLRILVIDDEKEVLRLVRSVFEQFGCEVVVISDGAKAGQLLEQERFDGILLDAWMPGSNGFDLTVRARSTPINREVPIVMLTASNDVETMRQGFKAGITFFLCKPFSREQLASAFRALRGPMLSEKRRHARLPFRTSVACKIGERNFVSDSLNIGEGGMLLGASGGADVGQEIEVNFSLPYFPKPVKTRVQVLRKDAPDRLSVAFTTLSLEQRGAIQKYVLGGVKE
jgi:CheY-like chemotaxis protein